MCGIVGYIGNENALNIVIHGLHKLEYRGYDSAGVAFYTDEIHVYKNKGRVSDLEEVLPNYDTTCGIGHTRWATHGEPNQINAHPHQDSSGRFTIVHNGVIENYEQLKERYLSDLVLKSVTDTEVIVELLAKFVLTAKNFETALRKLMKRLEGSYAIAILDRENPDFIFAAKNKSPMLIGKGNGFNMIGSDAMAMVQKTSTFYEVNDEEYAVISRDEIKIYEITGAEIEERNSFESSVDATEIEKGTYKHFMLKEIDEQPYVIRKIIKEYTDNGSFNIDEKLLKTIRRSDRIHIISAGTSYHAGLVGKQLLESIALIPTEIHIASEFVYNTPLLGKKPFFIFISQSGETADSRAVLVQIKKLNFPSLTITNAPGSTLSREADYTLLLHAGPEIAVASTKAYTAQVAVLAILANQLNENSRIKLFKELSKVANVMESICDMKNTFKKFAKKFLVNQRNCFYIGRHLDYYVALEAALKLKEISYIQTEGFAAGELKHGTIALIEDNVPVIAIISQKSINLNTRSNVKEVLARGANVLIISMKSISSKADQIVIDDVHPLLTPLVMVIPTQLISYYAALQLKLDIDKPRNLAKSVTVE